ncbi:MAG: Ig-like domain-containing protein, partial [Steroidobacteraceae bacterium]
LVRFVNAGLRMHTPSIVGAQTGAPAVAGFALIAEDGNPVPGAHRVQSEVLLPAGKTYDVMINAPATAAAALPVFDRQLSLSTNNQRDGGMQGYIAVNGGILPSTTTSVATLGETYYCVAGTTLSVGDPAKGVLANDVGANGATLGTLTGIAAADFSFNANGTFTYRQAADATTCGGSFDYIVNGDTLNHTVTATITQCDGSTPGCAALAAAPTANPDSYTSSIAARLQVGAPGVLENDSGLPLTAALVGSATGGSVSLNADGSFVVTPTAAAPTTVMFQYHAVNAQKRASAPVTASVIFNAGNGIHFAVQDAKNPGVALDDFRWIIEEDRTVGIDPAVETTADAPPVRNLAVNFHTSHMPVVATGCTGPVSCEGGSGTGQTMLDPATGGHVPAVCDLGNGVCRPDPAGLGKAPVDPNQVVLDPNKRYYISVLPGDAANDTDAEAAHTMGGSQITSAQVTAGADTTINIAVQPLPLKTAKISIYVFEDDFPLNGEADTGGGIDVLAPNEAGLGGFNIVLFDQTGQFGDPAGQLTYDEFGEPVSNSLAGKIDPATGLNACAISPTSADGFVGMIVTCPKFEANADGSFTDVLSPLAGHAIVANMYPGMYEAHTTPGADRIARGEEWLQTNTLDGTKEIEAFVKADEPAYFQEFGPGGFHIAVGFANPAIINGRRGATGDGKNLVCSGQPCNATIHGIVTGLRMSRTPDQRVYSSGSYDMYSFAQCYVSLGAPDSADFAFTKCDGDGKFTFENVPRGNMKVTVFDQWNDLLVDGLSTPVGVPSDPNNPNPPPVSVGTADNPIEIAVTQWRTNLYGRIFLDQNGDGVSQDEEPGLPLVPYNIRYRDGSYIGFNNT